MEEEELNYEWMANKGQIEYIDHCISLSNP